MGIEEDGFHRFREPMPEQASGLQRETGTASHSGRDARRLHDLLVAAIDAAGAHIGALYLLDEDQGLLLMDAQQGIPLSIAKAWSRVRLSEAGALADAMSERRLVWLADLEELARSSPYAGLVMPYRLSMVVAPIRTGDTSWGALLLAWPPGQTEPTEEQRQVIERTCERMGTMLHEALLAGQPVKPRAKPRMITPWKRRQLDLNVGMATLDCLNSLPEGYLTLNLKGRITFLNPPAAELLGDSPSHLLG
ncbi:GAF domain-containing protein [Nonomuraea ferruginea]